MEKEVIKIELSEKEASKKGDKKRQKKISKKMLQAIKTLTKLEEKSLGEMFSLEPTENIILVHFGVGTEFDFKALKSFVNSIESDIGKPDLDIFPGFSHGFIEFQNTQFSERFVENLETLPHNKCRVFMKELEFEGFGESELTSRFAFFFFSRFGREELNITKSSKIPDASVKIQIPGLKVFEDFLTKEEEDKILEEVDNQEWKRLTKRRVQHYGYEFLYGVNRVNPENKLGNIPEFIQPTMKKLNDICIPLNQETDLDQLTINEYFPGQGIPPHVDSHAPFKEAFGVVCLGSGTVMTFKSYKGEVKSVYLPPRSAYVLTGESRYAWYHSIAERKVDRVDGDLVFRGRRVSLTFRAVNHENKCECNWPIFCDSRGFVQGDFKLGKHIEELEKQDDLEDLKDEKLMKLIEESKSEEVTKIEKEYVEEVYEKIACHFSHTRHRPWPQVTKFLNSLPENSTILDVGCGNGKYLNAELEKPQIIIGTDITQNLLKIAVTKSPDIFRASNLNLPVKSNSVDACISIAVIHHFSNPKMRMRAIEELIRITKTGGLILITVWAFEQNVNRVKGFDGVNQDVFVPWSLQKNFHKENVKEGLEVNDPVNDPNEENDDVLFDVNNGGVIYKRYYHLFKKGELDDLVREIGDEKIEIVESFWGRDNWCLIIKKLIE